MSEGDRFRPSKKLGQNFLVDEGITRRIAESAKIEEGELVLEVGPGKGILTRALLEAGARVLAIEMDWRLHEELRDAFAPEPRLEIIRSDVLDVNLDDVLRARLGEGETAQVVANLPYSVAGPAIFAFLEASEHLSQITVMLQKEMADRIAAGPGSKTYGSISAAIALHGEARLLFPVKPGAFRPRPRVDSAVIQIRIEPRAPAAELRLARKVVRAAFARRRKQLRNSLLESGFLRGKQREVDAALAAAGIDPRTRAEQLGADDFLGLSRRLGDTLVPPERAETEAEPPEDHSGDAH